MRNDHGHGENYAAPADPDEEAVAREESLPHRGCPMNTRNMFSTGSDPKLQKKRFRGTGNLTETVQELAPIAKAMCRAGDRGQGGVPSGYTYLAQFVAHDIAILQSGTEGGKFSYKSKSPDEMYHKPLTLATLYGPQTETAPPLVADPKRQGFCRLHRFDPSRIDVELYPSFDLHRDRDEGVAIYDTRNDDTPVLAQTSAVFLALHNFCAERLKGKFADDDVFRFARMVTTEVYHQIIRCDLLKTLLHPAIDLHYGTDAVLIDRASQVSSLPTVELTHAAFRFGHAMVRPFYQLQPRRDPIALIDLLQSTDFLLNIRDHDKSFWKVDWEMFYGDNDAGRIKPLQRSGPLQPLLAPLFAEAPHPGIRIDPEENEGWRNDLAMRDLARSADGGLLSLDSLVEFIAPFFQEAEGYADWISFDPARRAHCIRDWLAKEVSDPLPDHVAKFLEQDPPLYFYVLLEAALPISAGGGNTRHLGVLGSILIAESVLPAIQQASLSLDDGFVFEKAKTAVFGDTIPPSTMLGLLSLLS